MQMDKKQNLQSRTELYGDKQIHQGQAEERKVSNKPDYFCLSFSWSFSAWYLQV